MSNSIGFDEVGKQTRARALRQAAIAYLAAALQAYIDIEGRVSVLSHDRLGKSAVVVCSLNRAIEHLLKLRLLKIDPVLLYPPPRKIEIYCQICNIPTQDNESLARRPEVRAALARTVTFKEALSRVELTLAGVDFDFRHFEQIYALRNSLEHHWDRNDDLLKRVVGRISSKTVPLLSSFIADILQENPVHYIDPLLLAEIDRLERALAEQHTLELQRRLEEHRRLFALNPELCRLKPLYPNKYDLLTDKETDAECPVCGQVLQALYDWEADYDVEGSMGEPYIVGAYPDPKCLYCPDCHFYIEGVDVDTYLPDGLDVEFEEDLFDEYW